MTQGRKARSIRNLDPSKGLHLLKADFQKRFMSEQCSQLTSRLDEAILATLAKAPVEAAVSSRSRSVQIEPAWPRGRSWRGHSTPSGAGRKVCLSPNCGDASSGFRSICPQNEYRTTVLRNKSNGAKFRQTGLIRPVGRLGVRETKPVRRCFAYDPATHDSIPIPRHGPNAHAYRR